MIMNRTLLVCFVAFMSHRPSWAGWIPRVGDIKIDWLIVLSSHPVPGHVLAYISFFFLHVFFFFSIKSHVLL